MTTTETTLTESFAGSYSTLRVSDLEHCVHVELVRPHKKNAIDQRRSTRCTPPVRCSRRRRSRCWSARPGSSRPGPTSASAGASERRARGINSSHLRPGSPPDADDRARRRLCAGRGSGARLRVRLPDRHPAREDRQPRDRSRHPGRRRCLLAAGASWSVSRWPRRSCWPAGSSTPTRRTRCGCSTRSSSRDLEAAGQRWADRIAEQGPPSPYASPRPSSTRPARRTR